MTELKTGKQLKTASAFLLKSFISFVFFMFYPQYVVVSSTTSQQMSIIRKVSRHISGHCMYKSWCTSLTNWVCWYKQNTEQVPSCFTCRASDHTQHTRLQRFSSVFREKYTDVKILGLLIKLSSCHFNNHVEYAAVLAPYTDLKFGMVTVLQKKK